MLLRIVLERFLSTANPLVASHVSLPRKHGDLLVCTLVEAYSTFYDEWLRRPWFSTVGWDHSSREGRIPRTRSQMWFCDGASSLARIHRLCTWDLANQNNQHTRTEIPSGQPTSPSAPAASATGPTAPSRGKQAYRSQRSSTII